MPGHCRSCLRDHTRQWPLPAVGVGQIKATRAISGAILGSISSTGESALAAQMAFVEESGHFITSKSLGATLGSISSIIEVALAAQMAFAEESRRFVTSKSGAARGWDFTASAALAVAALAAT